MIERTKNKKAIEFDASKLGDVNRVIERFVVNVYGFRFLDKKALHQPYGIVIQLNFCRIATLNWCKLFGTDNEEHHWKKVISDEFHDSFRQKLLSDLKLSQKEFKDIRDAVKDFRDNHTSHKETYPCDLPDFTKPLEICGILNDVINKDKKRKFSSLKKIAEENSCKQLECLIQ